MTSQKTPLLEAMTSILPDLYPENILYSGSTTVEYPCDNFYISTVPSNLEYSKSTVAKVKASYPAFGGSYDIAGNVEISNDPLVSGGVVYSIKAFYFKGQTFNVFDTVVSLDTSTTPLNVNVSSSIPSGLPLYADFTSGIIGDTNKVVQSRILWPEPNATTTLTFTFIDTQISGRWDLKIDVVTIQGMALFTNAFTDARLIETDLQSTNHFLPAGYGMCLDKCGKQLCPGIYISASTDVFGGRDLAQTVAWFYSEKNVIKGIECGDITTVVERPGSCNLYQTQFSRYPFKINCYVKGCGSLARKAARIAHDDFPGAWVQTIEERIITYALFRYYIGFLLDGKFNVNDVLDGYTEEFYEKLANSEYACLSAVFENSFIAGFNKYFYMYPKDCGECDDEEQDCDINIDDLDLSDDIKNALTSFKPLSSATASSRMPIEAPPASNKGKNPVKTVRK